MTRSLTRHLLLLLAVLHLAADLASAGGLVFCVGPDDHRELEAKHLSGAGCELSWVGEGTPLGSLPGECADRPLHPEADIAAGSQDPTHLSAPLLTLPSPFVSASPADAAMLRARRKAADSAPGLVARRTTILLL